jgi:hypothetical protein
LPISEKLRYTIPFQPAQATIDYLSQLADGYEGRHGPVVFFGDDGEKFGIWPETHEWVYEKGWLKSFFTALSENQSWLHLRLPHKALAERPPVGTVFLPCRSYKEMGEWAKVDPEDESAPPGHWRTFLVKYPESHDLLKRIEHAGRKMYWLLHTRHKCGDVEPIRADLLRAQCNCPYWHGVFGGIYLNYLRAANTKHLLLAERNFWEMLQSEQYISGRQESIAGFERERERRKLENRSYHRDAKQLSQADAQVDRWYDGLAKLPSYSGKPGLGLIQMAQDSGAYANWFKIVMEVGGPEEAVEAKLKSSQLMLQQPEHLSAWLDLDHGLCLRRLDYYPTLFCWTDVLARRREHYHHKLEELAARGASHEGEEHASIHDRVVVKEEGLEKRLVVDPHQRVSFVSYFSDVASAAWFMTIPDPAAMQPRFSFRDFLVRCGEQLAATETPSLSALVDHGPFALRKEIGLADGELVFSVARASGELPSGAGLFWVEFNLTVLTDSATDRYLEVDGARHPLNAPLDFASVESVALVDEWQGRRIGLDCPGRPRLLTYPVYTVSSSEGGFERTYQGTCIMLGYPPQALLGQIDLRLGIEELKA